MKKKLLSLLMALAVVACMMPAMTLTAAAAEKSWHCDWQFTASDNTLTKVCGYDHCQGKDGKSDTGDEPYSVTISINASNTTYTGKAVEAYLDGDTEEWANLISYHNATTPLPKIKYYKNDNGEWKALEAAPVEVGQYKAEITVGAYWDGGIFEFPGWKYSSATASVTYNIVAPPAPITNYSVTFDPANGEAATSVSVTEGSPVAQPATPFNDGFELVAWVDENGNAWDFATAVTKNVKLTAQWKSIRVPVLLIQAADSGKNVKLSWNAIDGAKYYKVYGNQCGKNIKFLTKTSKTNFTLKKIGGKKLVAHKAYKYYVIAFDKNGKKIDKSLTIHFIKSMTKKNMANVTEITVNSAAETLAVGQQVTVGATYKVYKNMKHIEKSHGAALRFKSDCPKIASVNSNGVVTAKSAGTATIYIQDAGGKYVQTVVTVTK